jgi:hypothetical protein
MALSLNKESGESPDTRLWIETLPLWLVNQTAPWLAAGAAPALGDRATYYILDKMKANGFFDSWKMLPKQQRETRRDIYRAAKMHGMKTPRVRSYGDKSWMVSRESGYDPSLGIPQERWGKRDLLNLSTTNRATWAHEFGHSLNAETWRRYGFGARMARAGSWYRDVAPKYTRFAPWLAALAAPDSWLGDLATYGSLAAAAPVLADEAAASVRGVRAFNRAAAAGLTQKIKPWSALKRLGPAFGTYVARYGMPALMAGAITAAKRYGPKASRPVVDSSYLYDNFGSWLRDTLGITGLKRQ